MIKILNNTNELSIKQLQAKFCYFVALHRKRFFKKNIEKSEVIELNEAKNTFYYELSDYLKNDISKEQMESLESLLKSIPICKDLNKLIYTLKQKLDDETLKKIGSFFNWYNFRKKKFENKFICKALLLDIIKALGLEICPYCNRNYISCFLNKKKEIIIPTFDHFYEKSIYPYFAISLYNLIPCCDYCNSKLKNTLDTYKESILNPYLEGFENNVRFEIEIKDSLLNINNINIILVIRKEFKEQNINKEKKYFIEKCCNSDKKLAITNIYNACHKDLAIELYNKCKIYNNKAYITSFKKILKLQKNPYSVEQLLFGNIFNPYNDLKEPLSKFKRDIFYQFVSNTNSEYMPLSSMQNNKND